MGRRASKRSWACHRRPASSRRHGQTSLAGDLDWEELDLAEDTDRTFAQALPIEQGARRIPVADGCASRSAESQGFFHWELDFAPVFARGGFDLQVGNPPWVRPDWDEAGVLAEFDPWWQLATSPPRLLKQRKREEALRGVGSADTFLDERACRRD